MVVEPLLLKKKRLYAVFLIISLVFPVHHTVLRVIL